MREIFRFLDKDRKTLIRIVEDKSKFILEITGDDGIRRTPIIDEDFDHVSGEFSNYIMKYVHGIQDDKSTGLLTV